jgi:hypothetical protein
VTKPYAKRKGRAEKGIYFGLPHSLINTKKYRSLSSHAVKLMIDLGSQYRGFNNGDLCLSWTVMKSYGWRSRSTLLKAKNELLAVGFIINTRQGGRNRASLFAITWKEIDECKGKLDIDPAKFQPGLWLDSNVQN